MLRTMKVLVYSFTAISYLLALPSGFVYLMVGTLGSDSGPLDGTTSNILTLGVMSVIAGPLFGTQSATELRRGDFKSASTYLFISWFGVSVSISIIVWIFFRNDVWTSLAALPFITIHFSILILMIRIRSWVNNTVFEIIQAEPKQHPADQNTPAAR